MRLRGGLRPTLSSFLHWGPTACGGSRLRERSRATLQRHDGSERFAAATEAAAIDRRCDPRHGSAARARVEVHLDQLDQIADASTQLQRHGEHRPSAARAERGCAAPGLVECDLRITRRGGAPSTRADRRLGATRRPLGALVVRGGRGRVSGEFERRGRRGGRGGRRRRALSGRRGGAAPLPHHCTTRRSAVRTPSRASTPTGRGTGAARVLEGQGRWMAYPPPGEAALTSR